MPEKISENSALPKSFVKDFLEEAQELLPKMERTILELEKNPLANNLVVDALRCCHTLKSTCGFLGFEEPKNIFQHIESFLKRFQRGKQKIPLSFCQRFLTTCDEFKGFLQNFEQGKSISLKKLEDFWHRASLRDFRKGVSSPENRTATPFFDTETLKIKAAKIDKLLNLAMEVGRFRNQLESLTLKTRETVLSETLDLFEQTLSSLQTEILDLRLLPLDALWQKFPRIVRDMTRQLNKEADIVFEGGDTEVDKQLLEKLYEPMVHLVRNALAHGIEVPKIRKKMGKNARGTIQVRAWQEGNKVRIEICDDGAGIDLDRVTNLAITKKIVNRQQAEALSADEKIKLIFHPDISLASHVTEHAGRGVGMSIVQKTVEEFNGDILVESEKGVGTRVLLKFPLTLVIIPVLKTKVGRSYFAFPLQDIEETMLASQASLKKLSSGGYTLALRGRMIPVVALADCLGLPEKQAQFRTSIVLLKQGREILGVLVDSCEGREDAVIRPVGRYVKKISAFAGVAVLGTGGMMFVINTDGVFKGDEQRGI